MTTLSSRSRNILAASSLALAATGLIAPAAGASTTTAQHIQQSEGLAACGTRDVYIGGAEAHWTKCENAGYTQVNGWVKDTASDGKCAQVYALWSEGAYHESEKACPKGTIRYFYWNERGTASVYLRKVG